MMLTILILLIATATTAAQIPELVAIPMAIESPDLRDGTYLVTARWYDGASGGALHATERTSITITGRQSTIMLGNASPLPVSLLERGQAWISVQFDGVAEPTLRHHVVPNAFAHTAGFALVAASLDPRATGIVTSINEIAGAVEISAGNGISIYRNGQQLTLEHRSPYEQGILYGDGTRWEFVIIPQDTALLGQAMHCEVDSKSDHIPVQCRYDQQRNCYIAQTSALLQQDESLRWHIGHR
jgi:hypothetical protein